MKKYPLERFSDFSLEKFVHPLYGYKMKWPISYDENTAIVKKTVSI